MYKNREQFVASPDTETKRTHIDKLQLVADFLRKDALEVITAANNGHIGGSLSSVELLTAMYFGGRFNFDPDDPDNPNRDRILIRGHEGPIRYPIFSLLGYIDRDELGTYRQLGSRLQGHEDMHETPGVDITPSGSLGMLLSYGVGAAIASKEHNRDNRTIVFLGDGEEQEGNVSEAARHAAALNLDNLICIIDKNGKQLSRPTNHSDSASNLKEIWSGYGWGVKEIKDGHDIEEIIDVYDELQDLRKPTVVIAHTIKGYGVEGSEEHFSGYHTLSAVPDRAVVGRAIGKIANRLGDAGVSLEDIKSYAMEHMTRPYATSPSDSSSVIDEEVFNLRYDGESGVNLEMAQSLFFDELRQNIEKLEPSAPFYFVTPDLLRSDIVKETGLESFANFIDTGIREQHAIAMSHGISVEDPTARIYVCYGDAFVYRALDQMNAAAQAGSNILIAGENAGIFQGQNGKTHQSIGQQGALLHVPDMSVYEPSDINDLYNVFSKALYENEGVSYVRLHRGTVKLDRDESDKGATDAYYVHKTDKTPELTIIGSGFMLQNAVDVAKTLETEHGIPTSVINVVDQKSLSQRLPEILDTDAPILTVYNGDPSILKNSVSSAILENPDISKPRGIIGHGFTEGTSGSVSDLIRHFGFDEEGITNVALEGLRRFNK